MLEQEAFAFIEDLERRSSTDEVLQAIDKAFRPLGFDTFVMNGLPHPAQRNEEFTLVTGWPDEFVTLYVRGQYARHSPLSRRCKETVHPFAWLAASYFDDPDLRAAEVMRRAADFGLDRGFIIPIHGPRGYAACAGLTGAEFDLTAARQAAIHLMINYAFFRLRGLLGLQPAPSPPLTVREREVLTWIAAGKSAWEIGEILKIAKRTVDLHSQTAARKLGAVNRAQAVAIALRNRIIEV